MFHGMSGKNFDRLQLVQNRAAIRTVCSVSRRQQSAVQLRHSLHWLPVRSRTDFKLATLCFKSQITGQPVYLAESLHPYHRHWIYLLYLTLEQSWVGVVSQ